MRRNILLVDDDPDFRDLVGFYLRQAGFVVKALSDGLATVNELERNHFDLLLLDISMPHVSGFRVLESVRSHERLKDLPVMVLTARDDFASLARVQSEVTDYVLKPVRRDDLLKRIERVLGGRPQLEEACFSQSDPRTQGDFKVPVQLTSLSVNGLVLRSPIAVPNEFLLNGLECVILRDLNLGPLFLRVSQCKPLAGAGFEYFVSFLSLSDSARQKLGAWIVERALREQSRTNVLG